MILPLQAGVQQFMFDLLVQDQEIMLSICSWKMKNPMNKYFFQHTPKVKNVIKLR